MCLHVGEWKILETFSTAFDSRGGVSHICLSGPITAVHLCLPGIANPAGLAFSEISVAEVRINLCAQVHPTFRKCMLGNISSWWWMGDEMDNVP